MDSVLSSALTLEVFLFLCLENEFAVPKGIRAPNPVEKVEIPPNKSDVKPRMSDPTANSEIVHAAKRPLSRLVSGPVGAGPKSRPAKAISPVGPMQSRDSTGSSSGEPPVASAKAPKKKEPRSSGFCIAVLFTWTSVVTWCHSFDGLGFTL